MIVAQMTKLTGDRDNELIMRRGSKTKIKKNGAGTRARLTSIPDDVDTRPRDSIYEDDTHDQDKGAGKGISADKPPKATHYTRLPRLENTQTRIVGVGAGKDILKGESRLCKLSRRQTEYYSSPRKRSSFTSVKRNSLRPFNAVESWKDTYSTRNSSCVNAILERDYSQDIEAELEYTSNSQSSYFSKWTITGFSDGKVVLSNVSDMEETKVVTPEFVQYIKERDAALEEVKKAQGELRETQCKLYDAIQLIEKLEKKVADISSESKSKQSSTSKPTTSTSAIKKAPASNKKPAAGKSNGLSVKGSTGTSSGASSGRTSLISSARTTTGIYHPPIVNFEPIADSRDYYWKISDKFSQIPMFTVLDAEKKFMKADADSNGYIDMDELDKVLSDTVGMFTNKQLEEIMKEIDLNGSHTLDFFEVLTVINKLVTRKKTNLPTTVQQNYTKTCTVQ